MKFSELISPMHFIISFVIGMFLVYISTPTPEIIIKYPIPDKAHNITYEDDGGMCYKLLPEEVDCKDHSDAKKFPVQQHSGQKVNTTSAFNHMFDKVAHKMVESSEPDTNQL